MGKILNLGSGDSGKQEGIINVDIRPLPTVDVVADVAHLTFPDNECEGVMSRNLIEHFGRHEYFDVVKEWVRVLQPGGFLKVETVDMGLLMDKWRQIPEENWLDGVLGAQTYPENFHKMSFTREHLEKDFEKLGLDILEVQQFEAREIPRIIIIGIKK
jgi:predicted SAM-dependent methyltransferase